jgi:hypothetical protein
MKRLEPWTVDEVVNRFREAGDTVRRLPRANGPAQFGSGWPPIVRSYWEAYSSDSDDQPTIRLSAPSPKSIDRAYEVFSWFKFFDGDVDSMRVVWLVCACRISMRSVARKQHRSRDTVRALTWAGVQRIVHGLNTQVRLSTIDARPLLP